MGKSKLIALLTPVLALGLTAAEPAEKGKASTPVGEAPATPLTPEQKTALAAVDARILGVEAIAAKVDDADYKASIASQIEDLKKRRMAMEKNFDPGLYEALMHSVISRYQVIALWLKPPPLPAPPGTVVTAPKSRKGTTEKSPDGLGAY